MAAEATSLVISLIDKAGTYGVQVGQNWYKASEAMESFPGKLEVLKAERDNWTGLLTKYGMTTDSFVGSALKDACQQLDRQTEEIDRLEDNCCMLFGRKLVFPESVTNSLDQVIRAFAQLPEKMIKQQEVAEGLDKAALRQAARLPFANDNRYVPLNATVTAVRQALESKTTGPTVALFGGPGEGKTSMAKYLALRYQDVNDKALQNQDVNNNLPTEQPFLPIFKAGVFYLFCGPNANSTDLLEQLWQDLGYSSLLAETENSHDLANPSKFSRRTARYCKELRTRLLRQLALVVLDDICESELIEQLLQVGEGVKYLITTQKHNLWPDTRCALIQITKPDLNEAYRLLESFISGFLVKNIESKPELKDTIDMIIENSDFNPLILTTLASSIRSQKAYNVSEWQSINRKIREDRDEMATLGAVLYGSQYSQSTLLTSMRRKLDSFTAKEQTVLLLACICETKQAPEVVFNILYKGIHNCSDGFEWSWENLEYNKFIEIESKTMPETSITQRYWSLHTMRQDLIGKIKNREVESLFAKLLEQSTGDAGQDGLITMLLVLYGTSSWRNQAAQRMGIPHDQLQVVYESNQLSAIKEFVQVVQVDGNEKWQEESSRAVTQVLKTYLCSGELDDDALSTLLGMHETMMASCAAARKWFYLKKWLHAKGTTVLYSKSVKTLVELLGQQPSSDVLEAAINTLRYISYDKENARIIGLSTCVIERLVRLLHEDVKPTVQQIALYTLGSISLEDVEMATLVGSYPTAIENLMGLLKEELDPGVQESAAITLGTISSMVPDIAAKIGSFPSAIERLVGLLAKEYGPAPGPAIHALVELSRTVVENRIFVQRAISKAPNALERLLECAKSEKSYVQYQAGVLRVLADVGKGERALSYQSSKGYEGEGAAKVILGDYTGALEAYDHGLAIDSKHSVLSRRKCFVKTKLLDFQGARTDADQYIEEGDDRSFGLQERGVLKRMMGDLGGALADLNEALNQDPDDYERLKHRGFVRFLLEDEDGARADAQRALEVKPSGVDNWDYGLRPCLGEQSVEYLGYKLK